MVPTKDSSTVRNELALSMLVEKLIMEIKRIKGQHRDVNLQLDEDVNLLFFSELHDKQNVKISADFQDNLKRYTQEAIHKLTAMGGNWTHDH